MDPRSRHRTGPARRAWSARVLAAVAIPAVGIVVLSAVLRLVGTASSEANRAIAAGRALGELYRLEALEAAAIAGDAVPIETFDAVVGRLGPLVDDAAGHLPREASTQFRAAAATYTAAARAAVVQALSSGAAAGPSTSEALDADVSGPAFRAVQVGLIQVDADAQAASAAAADTAKWGIVAITGGATVIVLGVLWWVVRINRRAAAHRAGAAAQARFRSLVEASHDQVYLIDPGGRIRYASPASERSWGSDVPQDVATLVGPIDEPERTVLLAAFEEGLLPDGLLHVHTRLPTGKVGHFEITMRDLRADPAVGGIVVTASDVTEQHELHQRLRQQAQEDELTGLPNRRALNGAIQGAAGRTARHGSGTAVVLIDLDGFKGVNDTLGHHVGDELLRQVAQRLRAAHRAGETIGRFGGDEFAVVLEDVDGEDAAMRAAGRFLEALREPYDVGDDLLVVNASLGLSVAVPGHDVEEVLRHADIALYEAKQSGRNRLVAFRPDMEHLVFAAARLQRELSLALARGELSLVYQPLCSLGNGAPVGFEALMRWHSPSLGEVSPLTFIPVAERSGLIGELGRWALGEACRQLAAWRVLLPGRRLMMSVNVSVVQLAEPAFVDQVRQAVVDSGIDPGDLQLEVTESALADDLERLGNRLGELRALGVRIALDDFGTGYSSMGQLQRLPVDCIKIDQSFVAALRHGGERAQSVVDALIDLGAALGLSVVAEGIEDLEQLEVFRRDDCDLAQGYLLARPMPAVAALAFVREHAVANFE